MMSPINDSIDCITADCSFKLNRINNAATDKHRPLGWVPMVYICALSIVMTICISSLRGILYLELGLPVTYVHFFSWEGMITLVCVITILTIAQCKMTAFFSDIFLDTCYDIGANSVNFRPVIATDYYYARQIKELTKALKKDFWIRVAESENDPTIAVTGRSLYVSSMDLTQVMLYMQSLYVLRSNSVDINDYNVIMEVFGVKLRTILRRAGSDYVHKLDNVVDDFSPYIREQILTVKSEFDQGYV